MILIIVFTLTMLFLFYNKDLLSKQVERENSILDRYVILERMKRDHKYER